MALVDNTFYCNAGDQSTTGHYAVTKWSAGASVSVGALRRQNAAPSVGNERVFVCIVAGTTSNPTEPTWTVTRGAKTTDNTATWQECTGICSMNGDVTNTPAWSVVKNTSVILGQIIKDGSALRYFICTTAGTAGNGSEPTWNTTAGATTADNTVTWTCLGTVGSFSAWAAPHARIANVGSISTVSGQDNVIYIADNNAESSSAAITPGALSGGVAHPTKVLCVNHAGSMPPASGDLTTGATITSSLAGAAINLDNGGGATYWYGITFIASANATNMIFVGNITLRYSKFESCSFKLSNASATTGRVVFGNNSAAAGSAIELINTTFDYAHSGQAWLVGGVDLTWRNTASPFPTQTPTLLANLGTAAPSSLLIEGVDISGISGTVFQSGVSYVLLKNCKVNGSATFLEQATSDMCGVVDLENCDSGGTNYRNEHWTGGGIQSTNTSVYRTGGMSIEGTNLSHKIASQNGTTGLVASWSTPFAAMPVFIRNGTTGSNVNVTLYGIINDATVPNNDGVWFDVSYLGSASSPIASRQSGTKSNVLTSGSALTADTSAWDGGATARANTHAYSLGDIIKVASNPGRLFFCTTAGTSAGSEPGGYASAVDGGSVTDSGAVFRAGCRFKQTVTLSSPQPAQAGYLTVYPRVGKSAATLFIDPLPVLS